jgi:hypothetical protein
MTAYRRQPKIALPLVRRHPQRQVVIFGAALDPQLPRQVRRLDQPAIQNTDTLAATCRGIAYARLLTDLLLGWNPGQQHSHGEPRLLMDTTPNRATSGQARQSSTETP